MKLFSKLTKKKTPKEKDDRLIIKYRGSNWRFYDFDISPSVLAPYNLNYGDRVDTPLGPATVIGVRKGNLWFHVDRDTGASFWDSVRNHSDLKQIGISLLQIEKNGFYKLQKATYQSRQITVIVQSSDNPFPLIPIVNLLALRRNLTIGMRITSINASSIVTQLSSYLIELTAKSSDELVERVTRAVEQLSNNEININIGFTNIDHFEKNEQYALFELLGIRLVHGWVIDPEDSLVRQVIGNRTFREIEAILKSENADSRDGEVIKSFLNKNACQLTYNGYTALLNSLNEDEMCVLFRKDKFSTLMRSGNQLFELAVDETVYGTTRVGEKLPNFHWEPLRVV